jgi:D-beta-D-heptose 7-phosphate kinase/D-beta-D-heptose 1-phosphate adenosyltransferase
MAAELAGLVRSFGGQRILLVGDLIYDQYIYGDAERVSPEAPVPILRAVERGHAAGGSANVAACLTALGLEVACCGIVGHDPKGTRLLELLRELGVDVEGIVRVGGRPTTSKTRLVGLAQHRHRQQLLRLDEECCDPLADKDAGRVRDAALTAARRSSVICIEDYQKGVVDPGLVKALVDLGRREHTPVLVDPALMNDYSPYRGATLLTPNRNELSVATGRPCGTLEQAAEAAGDLRRSLDCDAIVVTLDRDGAVLVRDGSGYAHIPTRPRSVYDNTGAGDAVLAMLAAAVAAGGNWVQAVKLANIAGGLEVEKFGCVPITRDEVLADLRLEQNRRNGKLRGVEELVAELDLRRSRGETIVFTNGCYDLLHVGHVEFLTRARELGSLLVVGLNSDASIRVINKGPGRPICNEQERARVIGALECVDYVVLFDQPDPDWIIRQVKPDVLAKGEDWAVKGVIGREFVESRGGRVELLPLVPGCSTTSLIERVSRISLTPAEPPA